MTKSVTTCLALGFVLIAGSSAAAEENLAKRTQAEPRITVRVYDYAQVSLGTFTRAKGEAERVFQTAGVHLELLECIQPNGEFPPECNHRLNPTHVVLRIIRPSKEARAAYGKKTGGFALRSVDGSGGTLATIFYDVIEDNARRENLSEGLILGYVIAHEIGHLLLPPHAHTRAGLMCAELNGKALQQAAQGRLLLTLEEGQLIRAAVLQRIRQEGERQQSVRVASME